MLCINPDAIPCKPDTRLHSPAVIDVLAKASVNPRTLRKNDMDPEGRPLKADIVHPTFPVPCGRFQKTGDSNIDPK